MQILNEGGNVFKTPDGAEATQRINKADVAVSYTHQTLPTIIRE